jgi:gliding motility-associated-like protein
MIKKSSLILLNILVFTTFTHKYKLMKKLYYYFLLPFVLVQNSMGQNCEVNAFASDYEIVCGESITLSAFTQQALWNNPCSPNGVDGTRHIWFGNASPVPRELRTQPYNLATASVGVTVCFDMLFAAQGSNAPCEGPDEPDEGVYLQYSTNGTTWNTIHYFDPNGGNDPQLVNWNNWCFPLPSGAITPTTQIRWFQDNDSGADYDHWGIDNVEIYFNDASFNIVWQHDGYNHGATGGINPTPVRPRTDSTFIVVMSNGSITCRDSVNIHIVYPTVTAEAGNQVNVCVGQCGTINASANVLVFPADTTTFSNNEFQVFPGVPLAPPTVININVQGLNMNTVQPNSILSVCIDNLTFQGQNIFPPGPGGLNLLQLALLTPDGTRIILVPTNTTTGGSLVTGYTNTCFVPNGQVISGGAVPYSGNWRPNQPFSTFNGHPANGVWALEASIPGSFAFGIGTFFGWNITFADPEQSYQGVFNWSPMTNLSPTNSLTPQACPPIGDNWYFLTVSDTAGCVEATDSVLVRVTNCCNYNVASAIINSNCGQSNGSISLTPDQSGTYTYLWNTGVTTQSINNLQTGTYQVTVTNSVGCQVIEFYNITDNAPLFSVTPVVADESCFGFADGSIVITPAPAGNYTYIWGHTAVNTNQLSNLAGGTYNVTVSNGTCTITSSGQVGNGIQVNVDAGLDQSVPTGTNVTLTATATPSASGYTWTGAGLPTTTSNPVTFIANQSATYYVTATTGPCFASDSVHIFILENGTIEFHNAFTPNADQVNDTFFPKVTGSTEIVLFEIYNRWGQLMHHTLTPWDGTFKGELQPKETYFYKVKTNSPTEEYHGDLTLVR